jgi:plasmid stabilization system protein ParE
MYQLEYLPIAMQDMIKISRYISYKLLNPTAASKLADEMIKAVEDIVAFPYSKPVHITPKPLKQEYRKLAVKNYVMFYWVDETEKKIVIARVIYARRDFDKLLF